VNIYQKLIEVRKTVPYLQKESKGYQYSYCGSSQVLSAVKTKMDELGLLLVPRVLSHTLHPKGETDAKEHLTELEMEFTWVNSEKPEETIVCPWYGQGLDTGEKGVGKALTYAEKYFMLKFFNIATDKDDPDSFQGGGKSESAKKPRNTSQASPKNKPQQTFPLSEKQIKRFYAIVRNSGAGDEVTKLVVEKVAPQVMRDGKIIWEAIDRNTYDRLCTLFESGDWQNEMERIEDEEYDDLDIDKLDEFLNGTA
jgi:hypothetical protein